MGILSSIFGRKKVSINNDVDDNPWAGLSSYEDPEKAEREGRKPKLFCGRDEESHNVAQLIAGNIFVTLYGKSGTGKTSLLNAGVFPRLRQKRYLPLSIRLSMDAMDINFQQCIIHQLTQAINNKRGMLETINVVDLPQDERRPDYLWIFFARTKFLDGDGRTLFPVIVFDQFEEVFRDRRDDAEVLLRQIAYMMDESHALSSRIVNGQPYKYDFNFRFVASIREDDLYRLEDSIDNCYLPELKRCRYRLRSLTEQGARDVILIPGEGLFKIEEQKIITDKIIDKSRNEDGSISTNIISLLCSRMFVDFKWSGNANIALSLVASFLKDNPFERFYNEATRSFSNREKSYIEEHFVDSTGRRNSIPENDFLVNVKNGKKLIEGKNRILQLTSISSDSKNYRVELIHDSFCEPLIGQKEKRKQHRRMRIVMYDFLGLLFLTGIVWLYFVKTETINNKDRENLLLATVQKAQQHLNSGDSYKAQIILLRWMSQYISEEQPLPATIESILRAASSHSTAVLNGHENALNDANFSSDGKYLISASYDRTARLWDVYTGEMLRVFSGHKDWVLQADFGPDDKTVMTFSFDKTIKVWDVITGRIIKEFHHPDITNETVFGYSTNKSLLYIIEGKTIKIYDARTYECINSIQCDLKRCKWLDDKRWLLVYTTKRELYKIDVRTGKSKFVLQDVGSAFIVDMAVSPDGEKVACAFGYHQSEKAGYTRIWDIKTGKILYTLGTNEVWVNGVCFHPNGKLLVTTSMGGQVVLWDMETGACIDILKGHNFASGGPRINQKGDVLVTVSADFTIRLWDIMQYISQTGHRITSKLVKKAGYLSNGKRLALLFNDSLCLYDAKSLNWIRTISNEDSIQFVECSSEGNIIGAIFKDRSVGIYNLNTNKWINYKGYKGNPYFLSMRKDGKLMLISDMEKIDVWDLTNNSHICEIKCPKRIYDANFVANSDNIIWYSSDSLMNVWNIRDRKYENSWKVVTRQIFGSNHISPDGRLIILPQNNMICIYNIKTGECVSTLEGHISSVCSCSFSHDGKYVVSTSHDNVVKIWEWKSEICVQTEKHIRYMFSQFCMDDRHILLNSEYDTRIIDFLPLNEIIDKARKRFEYQLQPHDIMH